MVGDKVEVVSRSYDEAEPGHVWTSTGSGSYTIDTTTDVRQPYTLIRGKIIVL
jgi:HSP90 family molecular chaperone